jgi:hypothetical protein
MPQIHEITHEVGANDIEHFSAEHTQVREHSQYARSKKVIQGPTFVPKHETQDRTVDPIQTAVTAASASLLGLKKETAYRLVSSVAAYFRLSAGASAAVVGDIYLPADTPIIVHTGTLYDRVSLIRVSADGIAQVVEVK